MLSLEKISAKIGRFRLRDISLAVAEGDYMVLLGRSGSGKTQLLELIAGLVVPDSGLVVLRGKDITYVSARQRGTGLVFQDFALFPHMTVYDNIAYSLKLQKMSRAVIDTKVREIASRMNILSLLERKTDTLSGGEKQRTALARTLITGPSLLLLDEPLASVDASLKDDITRLLRRINREGQTIIHVTHDYTEAISLATRIGVLHNGRLIQSGTPAEVFNRPANRFVARYTGIKNFFRVTLSRENGVWQAVTSGGCRMMISDGSYQAEGLMVIRNRNIKLSLSPPVAGDATLLRGVVNDVVTMPAGIEVEVYAGETIFASVADDDRLCKELVPGKEVYIKMEPDDLIILDGRDEHGKDGD